MANVLIDRELLERVCHRDNSTRQLARRELRTILTQTAPEVEAVEAPSIELAYAIGAKGGVVNDAERVAFEAWMAGHCWPLCAAWNGEGYKCESEQGGNLNPGAARTRMLWAAWRDRAALAVAQHNRIIAQLTGTK